MFSEIEVNMTMTFTEEIWDQLLTSLSSNMFIGLVEKIKMSVNMIFFANFIAIFLITHCK